MEWAFLTVNEFCERYRVSRTTFYKERAAKRLVTIKIGRRTFVRISDAELWAAQLATA